jgi:hypothetical protein
MFKIYIFLSCSIFCCMNPQGICQQKPCNPSATQETKALYYNLQKIAGKAVLFGHQDALAYGVNWSYIPGMSDVKKLTGDYPALFGWELGNLELGHEKNLDSVPFSAMKSFIQEGYAMGSVITISWHANNPLSGKSAWDPAPGTVASILPGGSRHAVMMKWLAKVADFMEGLTDKNGNPIPVLFRPWHELTGNWFWWCENVCTPQEFKALWKMTYEYMVHTRKLNHLLWVYNTSGFESKTHFLERYPGNQYADIISYDDYQHENQIKDAENSFTVKNHRMMAIMQEVSTEINKPMALAETGFETIPKSDWWTNDLQPLLLPYKVAYVMLWRNAGKLPGKEKLHYYVPYPGDVSAENFKLFIQHPTIWVSQDVKKENIYKR